MQNQSTLMAATTNTTSTLASTKADVGKTRRLELILRQVDALPTLPVVATRLLTLTASDDSDVRDVIELVSSDQALTAKVLSMCRSANRSVRDVTTVDKAVKLLGFDAIRNAVLSIKVVEAFTAPGDEHNQQSQQQKKSDTNASKNGESSSTYKFNHTEFWRHCLAVAVAAELIAQAHPERSDLRPAEAFVCGLLHDIGKLALERILPKSYQRVLELVEINQGTIAEFERRIVGMDHHTAGKRLGEHWQLPHLIQDTIWLHSASYDTVPQVEHRRMVGLIGLADLMCRSMHIGYSGNYNLRTNMAQLSQQIGLDPERVEKVMEGLIDRVSERAFALGLDDKPSQQGFLNAIQNANDKLGRLNGALTRRSQTSARQSQILEAIAKFHSDTVPGSSVEDVLSQVVTSACSAWGPGFYAMLYQSRAQNPWLLSTFDETGVTLTSHFIDPPQNAPDISGVDPSHPSMLNQMGILPWLAEYLGNDVDVRQVRMQPLGCGWGTAAVLLHDRSVLPQWQLLNAITHTWGAAIAAATQHDGSRRLGEQLADANHELAEAQHRLLRNETMARVGEMAAGAAHEMNNPLAVISGRSQLLAQSLTTGSTDQKAAQIIVDQSHHLSDLITSLRLYADPPKAERVAVDTTNLLDGTIRKINETISKSMQVPIYLKVNREMPTVWVDPEQIQQIVTDLTRNAIEALPKTSVDVNVRIDQSRRVLIIQVADDGIGMDEHTLSHALDPFFSARPAGRNVGMGLPRSQQYAAAHGGQIELKSTLGEGTLATLTIPLDSGG